MNNSILSLYSGADAESGADEKPFPNLPDRTDCWRRVAEARGYDLVIMGGGLTAAVTAHQAALLGIRVLVLHESYFGSSAQSWSLGYRDLSKMPLVSRLKNAYAAGSTARILPEHLSSSRVLSLSKRKPSVTDRLARRMWGEKMALPVDEVPTCDERGLVRETVLAARQEGAVCIADVEISYVEAESDTGFYTVGMRDPISQQSVEIRAGSLLLDPSTTRVPTTRLGRRVGPRNLGGDLYQRVVCRIRLMNTSDLCRVRAGECGSNEYLVMPTALPETVEIVVSESADVAALIEEIAQGEGYDSIEVISVAGFRQGSNTRHDLEQYGGLFFPRERGPWDAWLSAGRVISQLQAAAHQSDTLFTAVVRRVLPGTVHPDDIERFRAAAAAAHLSEEVVSQVVKRWHGRVRYIPDFERGLELVCHDVLRGEVELAYRSDQVASVEDLLFGSLRLDTAADWRQKSVALAAALAEIAAGAAD
jgi:hypothetical protein